jgi:hypothetical protein
MLEGYIQVEKDIAVKVYKKDLRSKAVRDISFYYAWRLFIVWAVIIQTDAIWGGNNKLIFWQSIGFIVLWISASIYEYRDWSKRMDAYEVPSYTAVLDDTGVTIKSEILESRHSWDSYKSYKEHDRYIKINFTNGGMSLIPKTPELFEIIEFTKSKLPSE